MARVNCNAGVLIATSDRFWLNALEQQSKNHLKATTFRNVIDTFLSDDFHLSFCIARIIICITFISYFDVKHPIIYHWRDALFASQSTLLSTNCNRNAKQKQKRERESEREMRK